VRSPKRGRWVGAVAASANGRREREREVPMARCVRVDEVVWAGLFRFMEWAGPSSCFFF